RRAPFTPTAGPFAGERCDGIVIDIVEPRHIAPVPLGLSLARALVRSQPAFRPDGMLPMLGDRRAEQALVGGARVLQIERAGPAGLEAFLAARSAVLMY